MLPTILTPTSNLDKSIDFYEKLNFKLIKNGDSVIATAKDMLVEINANRYTRAGLKLYRDQWGDIISQLSILTHVTELKNGYLISDANGIWIYLINGQNEKDASQLHELPPSVLGNFAGLSIESTDVTKTVEIYKLLGFELAQGSADQGWVMLIDENKFGISVMRPNTCPHLFFNPSLTFFNGKNNPAIIDKIRSLGIPITEEITHFNKEGKVDNIIIRDPGGYGFFIFND